MSVLPTDADASSMQDGDGEFVDAMASVSLEEALVRAVEMAEPCCELARSAKLDTELLKVLTSYPFSMYPWLNSTG